VSEELVDFVGVVLFAAALSRKCDQILAFARDNADFASGHAISSSDESTMAKWLCLAMYWTLVMPSTLFNLPAGTTMGPA